MKQSAAKQTLKITAVNGIVRALGMLLRILLSRLLGAEIMGIAELSQSVHMLAITPLTSGLPLAVSRMTAKTRTEDRTKPLLAGLWLVRIAALVLMPLMLLFSPQLARLTGDVRVLPSLWCSAPCILILGYSAVYNGYLYGVERSLLPAWSELVEQLLRLTICVGLLLALPHLAAPWAAAVPVFSTMAAEVLGLAFVLAALRLPLSPMETARSWRKPVLRLALPTTGTRLVQMLLRAVEAVWIPLRLQASGLAAREATARLGMLSGMVTPVLMLPCVFTGSLSMVLLPRIALAEKEPKELRRLVAKCFLTAAPAGLGSTGAVWLAAPLLARWLYRLPELTPLFRFGAPLCLLFAFAHVSGGILSALGLQKLSMLGSLPVSGLTLLLIWLLPARPELRQYGVLLAQGIGQFCTLLWNLGILIFRQKMRLSSDESEKDALSAVQPL